MEFLWQQSWHVYAAILAFYVAGLLLRRGKINSGFGFYLFGVLFLLASEVSSPVKEIVGVTLVGGAIVALHIIDSRASRGSYN